MRPESLEYLTSVTREVDQATMRAASAARDGALEEVLLGFMDLLGLALKMWAKAQSDTKEDRLALLGLAPGRGAPFRRRRETD